MDILFHPDRSLFQVTGKEQKIPEIILRIIDISVCDVFMNRFFYDAAGYKLLPGSPPSQKGPLLWHWNWYFSNKGMEMLPGLLTELFRSVIILEHLIGFLLQETKMFSVGIRQNGMNFQIVQTCKNGFF